MLRFEYLICFVQEDHVLTANGHWQGTIEHGQDGDVDSCPDLYEYLAQAGAQGWELVALDPEDIGTARLFFKRARMGT